MENQKKKCSLKKHSNINAISFCQECKIYLCNKCQNLHPELHDDHNLINLKDLNQILIDICKHQGHDNKLEFYCKTHNTLCCSKCICKVKVNGYGQHSNCDCFYIYDIKDEKKNKLKENINHLEYLSNKFEETVTKLKVLFDERDKDKEDIKLKIQNVFTKIRNLLNDKEKQLLLEVDVKFKNIFAKDEIIEESQKFPNKIKTSLEKGKLIDKEWNINNFNTFIIDCTEVENNMKKINELEKIINKSQLTNNTKINFSYKETDNNENLKDNEKYMDNNAFFKNYSTDFNKIKSEADILINSNNYKIMEFYGIILCYLNYYEYDNFCSIINKLYNQKPENLYEILLTYNAEFKYPINKDFEFLNNFINYAILNKEFSVFEKGLNYIRDIGTFLEVIEKNKEEIFKKYNKLDNIITLDNLKFNKAQITQSQESKPMKIPPANINTISQNLTKEYKELRDYFKSVIKNIKSIICFSKENNTFLIYFTNNFWKYILYYFN